MSILNDVSDDATIVLLIIAGAVALIVWDYHRKTCPHKTGYPRGYFPTQ